ncbi:MAG TPA: DeoR/GlpR family DNA-binding transcription regulator [Anaerolineales bacterium]|nr:DeoR/GlpR family DNA-binding transcription regulator [Anaerolineales bacterium]
MSKPLIPAQRRDKIQKYLETHKIARTVDLYEMLETSEATVWRDLEWLERKGIIERTHGGAMLSQRITLEPEYQQRAKRHPEEKQRIGALAAALIEDGDIVFINSGTTTTQVIHQIRSDADITVFTNNLHAALEMGEPGFHHYLIGGEFQPRSLSLAGRFAIENLKQVYANKVVIGVDGISLKHGCTVPSNAEAEVVRLMIEHTKGQVIVAADHSKWGVVSNFQVASLDEIDKLVTDAAIEAAAIESLAVHSVESLIAEIDPVKP